MKINLLIEIGLEELPLNAVKQLAESGKDLWQKTINEQGLNFKQIKSFSTPRRIAWQIIDLDSQQQDQLIEKKGPSLQIAIDENQNWTKAAHKFADSCNISIDQLTIEENQKGKWLIFKQKIAGLTTKQLFNEMFTKVIQQLPIEKAMRWGDQSQSFVRPVHNLVVMADDCVWDLEFFGIKSSNYTFGHRIHHPKPALINHCNNYENILEQSFVIADYQKRKSEITNQIKNLAKEINAKAVIDPTIIDQVTALTEYPIALMGEFDEKFLQLPEEVLIATMQNHQKMFALKNQQNQLLAKFITVANLKSLDPKKVIANNEKVILPRFADAQFFYQEDLKTKLIDRLIDLKRVSYQKQLGSLFDKTQRIKQIALEIAPIIYPKSTIDLDKVSLAADLCKCDLISQMVLEFPELQGIIGQKYAEIEKIDQEICSALSQHYLPIGANSPLPENPISIVLAIADKLEGLIGGLIVGAKPTGSKDPYGLRRMAIGLVKIILTNKIIFPLEKNLLSASKVFDEKLQATKTIKPLKNYLFERLQAIYKEQNIGNDYYQAVFNDDCDDLLDFDQKIRALKKLSNDNCWDTLLNSTKRIRNILKKNGEINQEINPDFLINQHEKNLYDCINQQSPEINNAILAKDYDKALNLLSLFANPLDDFFTNVMVIEKNIPKAQQNRLSMLTKLQKLFSQIADFSLINSK